MFEVADGKLVGRSRAVVIDNVDPNKRGQVRVRHALLGDTVWIDYLKTPGSFDVPSIGDIVYIECDCGYDTHPIAWGNIVKGADDDLDIPLTFQRHEPTNRGLYSPAGHLVELDDGEGLTNVGRGVRITTAGGIKIHAAEGTPLESLVTIELPNGTILEIDGIKDSVSLSTNFGDTVELSAANGFQVSTPAAGGTTLSMKAGAVDLTSAVGELHLSTLGDIELKNANGSLVINPAGQVELKGVAGGLVDLMQQFAQTLSTDTFAGFGAPAGQAAKYLEIATKLAALKA
jgi:hypothetical protein